MPAQPLKSVAHRRWRGRRAPGARGEFVVTHDGVEGSLVYAASAPLRDAIAAHGRATLQLDLLPDTQPGLGARASWRIRAARARCPRT